ncbi:PAS and ANTAR domain-containing protein [Arthrobacter sp. 1P04PC]|uniref:PAS and ANTAR domain-containing protein n=2 Tax=Arthrobacter TaxID=1663 RepID=UPI0039A2B2D6
MWSKLETYLFPLPPGTSCPSGTFEYELSSGTMQWSDGLFGIHGLHPGDVVPTLELFMAHKHPSDRDHILGIWADLVRDGGQAALMHRIRDIRGRERRVFSAVQAVADATGKVDSVRGFMVDVTQSLRIESKEAAEKAIVGSHAHRELIEQAKGIVMALRGGDGPAAFGTLSAASQNSNQKLHAVAEGLVRAAAEGRAAAHLASLQIFKAP